MAMNPDPNLSHRDPAMADRDMNTMGTETGTLGTGGTTYDRDNTVYSRDAGGSNFLAFLIGGLVIAMGLLAFLFYDGGSTGRDVSTTGSTTPRIEAPAAPSAPTTPSRPSPAQ